MMPVMPLVPVPSREQAPILVVDDDPKILALVRTYLERERYRGDHGRRRALGAAARSTSTRGSSSST